MIVKDDLVLWFRNLESYRRIDIMCTLLNLCLPFELRFLGTCLEELGRRDAQDLRAIELRVNNSAEFVNDVGSFQAGQPTEVKVRRKMAMYLALMRACNRTGVNELFKTLDRWGDRDFTKFSDGDPLQELLLVYTMATNHPVFSFEQRLKCGEIYMKITSSKSHLNQQSPATTSPVTTPLTSSTFNVQQHQPTSPPPFTSATFQQQPTPQLINPQIPNPAILMAFPPATGMTPMIADPNAALALSVENLPPHTIGVPQTIMQIPADFTSPPPTVGGVWPMRYPSQIFPMIPMDASFPPQATSPHMSQPSSPIHSRTSSPIRSNQQQQPSSQAQPQMMPNPSQIQTQSSHRNNRPLRNTRPSSETTPPPLQQQQQQLQPPSQGSQGTIYLSNDIMVQTIKNFEDINMEGAISQLQSLRNGYNRPPNTIPRHSNKQNWTAVHAGPPNYNLHMNEPTSMPSSLRKSTLGSDSGGSDTGDASPPPMQPDPATGLHGNANQTQSSGSLRKNQPLNLSRLNGDFNNGSQPTLVTSASSGSLPLLIGGTMHHFPGYRTIPAQQPHQQLFKVQPNGELIYTFNPPFLTTQAPVVNSVSQRASPTAVPVPTPYPTNKMVQSCFNCGSTSHTGLNCSEASMEDVTRNAVYKLDYTANAPAQLQFMAQAPNQMTTSSSSSSLNLTTSGTIHPANNNEPDQQIAFIDLTQDTSSSSSSSSTSSIHGAK